MAETENPFGGAAFGDAPFGPRPAEATGEVKAPGLHQIDIGFVRALVASQSVVLHQIENGYIA